MCQCSDLAFTDSAVNEENTNVSFGFELLKGASLKNRFGDFLHFHFHFRLRTPCASVTTSKFNCRNHVTSVSVNQQVQLQKPCHQCQRQPASSVAQTLSVSTSKFNCRNPVSVTAGLTTPTACLNLFLQPHFQACNFHDQYINMHLIHFFLYRMVCVNNIPRHSTHLTY